MRNNRNGEMIDLDRVGSAKDGGTLDRIAQFSNIARPGILTKRLDGRVTETLQHFVVLCAEEFQHVFRQIFHVVRAISQGGQVDLNHIEPIIKVFAKTSFLNRLFKIGVGCRNDTDIRFFRSLVTNAFILSLLYEAKEFRL